MKQALKRRPVPSGRGLGFVKWQTKGESVIGILRDTFTLEDGGTSRDNIVLEVVEISAKVFNHGKEIAIETGDFICVGMGPKALNGRTKFLTEGTAYGVEYLGEGKAKKAGHNPPKLFDMYEVVGDDGEYIDETDDGDVPF